MPVRLIISLGLLVHALTAFSQLTETYFNDLDGKARGLARVSVRHGSSFIIGGHSFDRYPGQPSIIKTDLNGDVVWSTTTLDTKVYEGASKLIDKLMVSGDFVYATCLVDFQPVEIWKVDVATGEIVWKKAFVVNGAPHHIIDYDDTRFLLSYAVSYDGWTRETVISFIDKESGNVLNTVPTGDIPWAAEHFGLAVDPEKNIYFTKVDSIFKVSGADPSVVLWKTKSAGSTMLEYQHIHIDEDQVFAFGSRTSDAGSVLSLNRESGAFIWEVITTGATEDVEFSDMVDDGTNVVVTWKHVYVGGGTYNMWTTKIGKSSGGILWRSSHSFESDKTEAALDLTLDDVGDVLLTGYHRAANYGPGEWAFVKLNGTTGASIYGKTITENPRIANELSMGIAIHYIDGSAYMVGNQETFHNGRKLSTPAVVKINPISQEVLFKKYLYGHYQFPSRTIAMEPSGSNSVQLRQVGLRTVVGLYNGHEPVWEQSLSQNYALLGSNLVVSSDGGITVSGYSTRESPYAPYYDQYFTDSIHTFTFDPEGKILQEGGFRVYAGNCYPLETLKDGNRIFVLYRKDSGLFLRKIENGTVSAEIMLDLRFAATPALTKTLLSFSDTQILVAGYQNSVGPRLVKVNKTSLALTPVNFGSSLLYKINFVEKLDAQTLLIAGKKSSNKDALARYNVSTSTLVWSKDYTASSELYKFVYDQDLSAVYATGVKGDDLVVRKINTVSGDSLWSYNYNHSAEVKDIPLDIAIDLLNNKLVVAGYNEVIATPDAASDIFIHTINLDGQSSDLIIKQGEPEGKSKAAVVKVFSDGQAFVGGNLNYRGQLSGFFYSADIAGCGQLPAATISQVADDLIASAEGQAYQWIDCDTGGRIADAVNMHFAPQQSGNYLVEVLQGSCVVSSACFPFVYCGNGLQAEVGRAGNSLVAVDNDAEYQWIDCATALEIPQAVGQIFVPPASGEYKVRVSKDGCSLTSACFIFVHCDDILEAEVSQAGDHLMVSDSDAQYQWLDCSTGLDIPLAINQTFKPAASGQYKVWVSKDGCERASACFTFTHCNDVLDAEISQIEDYLMVSDSDATYQWIDCSAGFTVAVTQMYKPSQSGVYKIVVSKNGCSVTSACYTFEHCDDVVLGTEVTGFDDKLIVSESDATYQWIDCSTGVDIPLAVNQTFTPQASGQYKVLVSRGECGLSSACFTFTHCDDVLEAEVIQSDDELVVSDNDAFYQWIDCSTNQDIPGATGKTFVPQESGSYSVAVTKNSCGATSACVSFEKLITGLAALHESTVRLFPNPATQQVTVNLRKPGTGIISIKNPAGTTVLEKVVRDQQNIILNTTELPAGLYLILINTGSSLDLKKLVIE